MSIERTNTGNGHAEPVTNEEWIANGGLEMLAQEIIRTAQLTERVVNLVEALSDRVTQLEVQPTSLEEDEGLPLPEDFDLDLTEDVEAAEPDVQPDVQLEVLDERAAEVAVVEESQATENSEPLKVIVEQTSLLQALKVVVKAIPRSSVNPTLTNLKLSITRDKLTMTATDGEFTLQQSLPATTQGERDVLIPARLFHETVNGLPKVRLRLNFTEDALRIAEGGANCTISITPAEDYPELPQYSDAFLTSFSSATLKRLLNLTSFPAVKESSTGAVHYTNGVLLNLEGTGLDVVATDGHRLALSQHREVGSSEAKATLLIPERVASYMEQLLPDDDSLAVSVYELWDKVFIEIPPYSTGKRVIKHNPATLVGTSLIDVKFPPYERIIPTTFRTKLHVNRAALMAALKRCLLVCRTKDQNPVAHFTAADGFLTITADGGDTSQAEERLSCEGGDFKIALNPQYLLDVLRVLSGDDVIINWQSEVGPVAVTSSRHPEFIYIMMPIRMD